MWWVRGVRTTLNCHAFMYSLTQTLQYEVFQHELSVLYSANNPMSNMNHILLFENVPPVICLAYITWVSLQHFNELKIKKLDEISDYRDTRTIAKVSLFIFIHIFFRNIENAI
jgi:hypothetical protein